MSRQLKGLLYFFIADARRSFFIFWGILLGFITLGFLLAIFLLDSDTGQMTFGLSFAVYIYSAIFGFHSVRQGIPFALKMGATRKNIFIGLGVFLLGLALLQSLIANMLQTIFVSIGKAFSINTISFMSLAELLDNTWLTGFAIDAIVVFFIMATGFLIGLLFYKYGLPGGGGVIGLVLILFLFGLADGFLGDFFVNMYKDLTLMTFFEVAGVGILLYLLSWTLIRKITTEC